MRVAWRACPTIIDPVGGGWVASLARPDGPQVLPRTVSVLRGAEIAIGCYLLRCMSGHSLMARLVRARPGQGVGADRGDDRTRILGNHYSRVCGTSCWRAPRNSPDNC